MKLFSNSIQTLMLLCISVICNCKVIMNWNKCPLQSNALRTFHRVSVNECLKQCHIRNRCQLVCYRTGLQLCEIHETWNAITNCNRCMSVFREAIPIQQFGTVCACEDGQTCNLLTGACEYTECNKLTSTEWHIYGNLAYVGAKMGVRCYITGNYNEVSCTNTGQWRDLPFCRDSCPSGGDLITVTEQFQVRIFNKLAMHQEAKDHCSTIGGGLVKVDTFYKLDAIRKILLHCKDFSFDYWVDGYSKNATDLTTWKFSDGTPMPTDKDVFWGYVTTDKLPRCTRMRRQLNYMFVARRCDFQYNYICEMI